MRFATGSFIWRIECMHSNGFRFEVQTLKMTIHLH